MKLAIDERNAEIGHSGRNPRTRNPRPFVPVD